MHTSFIDNLVQSRSVKGSGFLVVRNLCKHFCHSIIPPNIVKFYSCAASGKGKGKGGEKRKTEEGDCLPLPFLSLSPPPLPFCACYADIVFLILNVYHICTISIICLSVWGGVGGCSLVGDASLALSFPGPGRPTPLAVDCEKQNGGKSCRGSRKVFSCFPK